MFRVYSAIIFAGLLAVNAGAREKQKPPIPEPTAVARGPQAGQVFDDLELDAFLEKETRRLHAEKKLGTLNLTARKCGVTLPATPTDKITWQEVAACAWRRVRS